MKIRIILGFVVLTGCFASTAFGSDCKRLHSVWESAEEALQGKHGNLIGLAIFRASWQRFLEDQSPTGFKINELPEEELDALEKFIEPIVFRWLEANPDTTGLTVDECLFEALKEPLGLKELR